MWAWHTSTFLLKSGTGRRESHTLLRVNVGGRHFLSPTATERDQYSTVAQNEQACDGTIVPMTSLGFSTS